MPNASYTNRYVQGKETRQIKTMEIKTVNRNIPENRENSNDRFRVRYKDKNKFHMLVVNICRLKTNEIQVFKFNSTELPDKDSIHFSTSIKNGKLNVIWTGIEINQKIKKPVFKKQSIQNIENKSQNKTEYSESFSPIVGNSPKVLILGTMPGKDSLRLQEYYANLRNIFWKIIYALFNSTPDAEYNKKIDFLKKNRISIWDVCHKGIRETSLDSDIKNEIPNDLKSVIKTNSTIETIAFNGQKAEKLYDKYFDRFDNIRYLTLLSTSPANASYSFENKLNNWKRIKLPIS